jgi:hypothetical protein
MEKRERIELRIYKEVRKKIKIKKRKTNKRIN